MNQIMVSIIIPIYNTEKYIDRCLQSVSEQDYEGLEIICIDDCSTDHSKEKLKRIQKKDCRVIILENEKNLGQGESRNIGLRKATGKYVWFVDSDDWITPGSIKKLVCLAEQNNADVVCFGANQFYENEIIKSKSTYKGEQKAEILAPISGKNAFVYLQCNRAMDDSVCRKFFLRRHLIENQLWFTDYYYEDTLYSLRSVICAHNVMAISEELYNYYRRANSTTIQRQLSSKHLFSKLNLIYEMNELMNGLEDRDLSSLLYQRFSRMVYNAASVYAKIDSIDREYIEKNEKLLQTLWTIGAFFYGGFFPCKLSPQTMDVLRNAKQIVVYGMGDVGQNFRKLLIERDLDIAAYIVTGLPESELFQDVPIYSVKEIKEHLDIRNAVFFIMNYYTNDQIEMKQGLITAGVSEDQIFLYDSIRK